MKQQQLLVQAVATVTFALTSLNVVSTRAATSPILLIPGFAASQLYVVDTGGSIFCRTRRDGLWINELRLLTEIFGCFSRELILDYNSSTNNYSAKEGVNVSVPGFSSTDTVEYLNTSIIDDPIHLESLEYLHTFVDYFVQRGYVRGKSIRAAPYDWRLAPEQLRQRGYYANLTSLIETMYRENNNTNVTIVVHSMGGPVSLYFLTSGIVTQEWKNTYIANYITLSGAWSGANEAIMAEISGIDPIPDSGFWKYIRRFIGRHLEKLLHPIIRSMQSTVWMLPRASIWNDTILVQTPTRNYTAIDYQDLFRDIGQEQLFTMYNGIKSINPDFPAPNVSTHCFYGIGLPTPQNFVYSESFPEGAMSDPQILMGDGDGTVNLPSSEICLRWQSSRFLFQTETFPGVNHHEMITNDAVLQKIGKIVGAPLDPQPLKPNEAITAGHTIMDIIASLLTITRSYIHKYKKQLNKL